jgi:hypothetical protein
MYTDMNLYMFRSKTSPELSCFCADPKGVGLPEKFSPWTAIGVLRRDQDPPHGLPRRAIEAGVRNNGFQLWRSRKKA